MFTARMRSLGAREEARAGARLREVEEIQERERRRRLKKKQLEERTRDLKRTVDDLERQVCGLSCVGLCVWGGVLGVGFGFVLGFLMFVFVGFCLLGCTIVCCSLNSCVFVNVCACVACGLAAFGWVCVTMCLYLGACMFIWVLGCVVVYIILKLYSDSRQLKYGCVSKCVGAPVCVCSESFLA